jgi:hypothetical protein
MFLGSFLGTTKPVSIGRRSSRLKTFAGIDSTCVSVLSGTIRPIDTSRLRSNTSVSAVLACGLSEGFSLRERQTEHVLLYLLSHVVSNYD